MPGLAVGAHRQSQRQGEKEAGTADSTRPCNGRGGAEEPSEAEEQVRSRGSGGEHRWQERRKEASARQGRACRSCGECGGATAAPDTAGKGVLCGAGVPLPPPPPPPPPARFQGFADGRQRPTVAPPPLARGTPWIRSAPTGSYRAARGVTVLLPTQSERRRHPVEDDDRPTSLAACQRRTRR